MIDRRLPFPISTLAAALATALLPSPSAADVCSKINGVIQCTLDGTYYSPQSHWLVGSSVEPIQYNSSALIAATPSPSTEGGLNVVAQGSNGTSSTLTGGDTEGLALTNTGNITLQSYNLVLNGEFYGLNARQQGGNAASDHSDGGNGGVAGRNLDQIVSVTNQGDIRLEMDGLPLMHGSGAAISAVSKGGRAAASNGEGGAGGQAVGAKVANTGNVTARLGGAARFAGIQAVSQGGAGADNSHGNFNAGGGGGRVEVINSGNVTVDWTWADGGGYGEAPALYGILVEAESGRGGSSSVDGNGGDGGKGYAEDMSARVVLSPGGSIKVTQHGTPPNAGAGVAARLIGGRGGDAIAGHDGVSGGNGGHAGAIDPSQAPTVQITNNGVSVTTSGIDCRRCPCWPKEGTVQAPSTVTITMPSATAGLAAEPGDGGVSLTSASSAVGLSTAGNQSPGIQARLVGGSGGKGGQYNGGWLGFGLSDGGDGGRGGDTGSVAVSLVGSSSAPHSITTSGDDSPGSMPFCKGGPAGWAAV